jgi:acyl-CoA thioesterase
MTTAPATTAFDRDTAVEPLGDGRFRATMVRDWFAPRGPNGGYVAAVLVRALEQVVDDPRRAPRSLTCHYLRPPAEGPCEIVVAVEREGRSLTSLSARLEQYGRPMVLALAAFGGDFAPVAEYDTPPPAVGPVPTELGLPRAPNPLVPPIASRFMLEPAFGPELFSGADQAVVGGWLRLAEPREADAALVALYTDAWLPSPWPRLREANPAPTVDLTIHFRARLPLAGADPAAPLLARFRSSTSRDGFFEEDGEVWEPDGTLVAQSRQLGILIPSA